MCLLWEVCVQRPVGSGEGGDVPVSGEFGQVVQIRGSGRGRLGRASSVEKALTLTGSHHVSGFQPQ